MNDDFNSLDDDGLENPGLESSGLENSGLESSGLENLGIDTLAIRAGISRTHEGEHSEPIFTTSSYVFKSAAEAAARFSGDQPGNVYSRYTNPTVRLFKTELPL